MALVRGNEWAAGGLENVPAVGANLLAGGHDMEEQSALQPTGREPGSVAYRV
jgi:hypothetical protein